MFGRIWQKKIEEPPGWPLFRARSEAIYMGRFDFYGRITRVGRRKNSLWSQMTA